MVYPKRDSFFAHRFVRLLHKTAVASEIGRDAFVLLVVVVHTEDAMRYRGAAKFWNSQMIETLGFSKWDQFDKARKRAVESGWLHYTHHGKRMAGEYFVTVPDGYELVSDAPIEPISYPDLGYKAGYKDGYDVGYKQGYEEGIKTGTIKVQSGVRSGDKDGYKQGEPSIPIPIPIPKPFPLYGIGNEIIIPESLNDPGKLDAISRWIKYTGTLGSGKAIVSNSPQEQALLASVARWSLTADQLNEWVDTAISGSWQNLNRPKPDQFSPSTTPTSPAATSLSQDEEWYQVWTIVRQNYSPDVKNLNDLKRCLTPVQFAAVAKIGATRVVESELKWDKLTPAAYRAAIQELAQF